MLLFTPELARALASDPDLALSVGALSARETDGLTCVLDLLELRDMEARAQ